MRLSFIILAASIPMVIGTGNSLSTTAEKEVTKVTSVASIDTGLPEISLKFRYRKRFLRDAIDDDEERLSGANMFNPAKIEEALGNAVYAKTLFRRWTRHGEKEKDILNKLKNMPNFKKEKTVEQLYADYIKWLYPESGKTQEKLFSRAKVDLALKDPAYANKLFERWKRYGLDSDDVLRYKLQYMNLGMKKMDRIHKDYLAWLTIHHPLDTDIKLAPKEFLFLQQRLDRAAVDTAYAEKLYKKWKTKTRGFDSDPVYYHFKDLGREKNANFVKVYEDYVRWLDVHYPLPARKTHLDR
ncbi:RxLR effector protein [Phytophthora megakarya]|uniref:RxLR effector protein n=1 Tax=Phytophthora megakarya TaxID=4795 RepID=A0A225WK13_9STRA|nr:RxLR effector protein [Phytophthora megakarya]